MGMPIVHRKEEWRSPSSNPPVRWMRRFLIRAAKQRGHTFEHTLILFLITQRKRTGSMPWQIRQAADATHFGFLGNACLPKGYGSSRGRNGTTA